MSLTRRDILRSAAAAGSVAALTGCERGISALTHVLGHDLPDTVAVPQSDEIDPAHHLVSRAGYGPWPGDLEEIRSTGEENWIEQQLHPDEIDDAACDWRARRFETIFHQPGTCFEYKREVLREEMSRHTLLRAVYSRRQLFEVIVAFWTDHLNINIEKGDCIYLKPADDREVIRRHALGRFRDLIRASATSPAMLVYLDNNQNARADADDVPNENYARELLELHTLGVDGGYTQRDVYEAARALTGWRVRDGFRRGSVYFDPALHDEGEKTLLGQTIPAGGGAQDLERVIDIVCEHPATAQHIATKLVRRFVADEPPASLVGRAAQVFRETDGQIKPILRTILLSEEFGAAGGSKFKPPFRFVVSALRAVGADTHAHTPLIEYLERMGQGIFQHPTPDGYPDTAEPWVSTLLWRWNFAYALAGNAVPSVQTPLEKLQKSLGGSTNALSPAERLYAHFAGRAPDEKLRKAMGESLSELSAAQFAGTFLASPAFQRY